MLDQYLAQLKSPDTEERRRAIIALGRDKNPAALPALADVYRNDPDPALRELALKAGRYIRQAEAGTTPEPAAPAPSVPAFREPQAAAAVPPDRAVSARDVEKARGYFNQALDLHVRHEETRAVEAMGKAIETNPALRHDTMFINLAMEMTGRGSSAAVELLSDPALRKQFILRRSGVVETGELPRVTRHAAEEATWNGALLDLGIYGLVNAAMAFVLVLVGFEVMVNLLSSALAASGGSLGASPFGDMFSRNASVPLALIYGLLYGLFALIGLLILDGAIHLVATTIMGGEGTLPRLIRKTTLFYTVLLPISTLLSLVPLLALQNEDMLPLFNLLSLVFGLGTAVWSGKLIGDAYDFGTGKGCASMVLGTIALAITFFCCIVTFTSALAQIFNNSAGF